MLAGRSPRASGRLIGFYDDNKIQLAGKTDMAFSEDVGERFEAYGWHVQNLGEDLSQEGLAEAIAAAKADEGRPSLIILRTHIGFGSPNKQDSHAAHGSPLGEDEVRLTKEAYGWDPDAHFLVPDEVAEHFREAAVAPGAEAEAEWNTRADAYRAEHPELWAELSLVMNGGLPEGWDADPPRFDPARRPDRHPQGLAAGDPVGRGADPAPGERLGRPRALHAHADRRRRLGHRATTTPGATCTTACASTAWRRS